jgi:hypothetical protein
MRQGSADLTGSDQCDFAPRHEVSVLPFHQPLKTLDYARPKVKRS